jgi:hypothetical protein
MWWFYCPYATVFIFFSTIWNKTLDYGSVYIVACRPVTGEWPRNKTTKQHPLLGNRFLISKYTQPLLSRTLAKKRVPTETIGVQQWRMFPTRSVPRCCKEENWSKNWERERERERIVGQSVERRLSLRSWGIRTVISRYQTTGEDTEYWAGLACAVVILKSVEISDGVTINYSHQSCVKVVNKFNLQPKTRLESFPHVTISYSYILIFTDV